MLTTLAQRHGVSILLLSVILVSVVAALRHAAARDDVSSSPTSPFSADTPLPVTDPVNEVDQPKRDADEAATADSLEPGIEQNRPQRSDPVLDELRKLIRDPDSGLAVPPIAMPPSGISELQSKPVGPRGSTSSGRSFPGGETTQPAETGDADNVELRIRLEQRVESVHHLALAAFRLSREARRCRARGQMEQSDAILERVERLQGLIGELVQLR